MCCTTTGTFERKTLAADFSLYLHRPTATDPSLAQPVFKPLETHATVFAVPGALELHVPVAPAVFLHLRAVADDDLGARQIEAGEGLDIGRTGGHDAPPKDSDSAQNEPSLAKPGILPQASLPRSGEGKIIPLSDDPGQAGP